MSACEKCWNEASLRTLYRGGSQYDNYIAALKEHEGDDHHGSPPAPQPSPAQEERP